MKRYLFFIEQPYCLSILRPLHKEIIAQGNEVSWFIAGDAVDKRDLHSDESLLTNVASVIKYNPVAVFVPGNIVPHFFPGVKVQVFHGLEWKKKGHFVIRGFFDLYCTHGKITTDKFKALSQEHGNYFYVRQTGWPKLDAYLPCEPIKTNGRMHVLFAPTFSPKLTSAYDLFEKIVALSKTNRFLFVVKFHPLMDKETVAKYTQAINDNLIVSDNNDLLALVKNCDVVLSDTSSAVTESLLLGKKVVTYKNSQPQSCLINFLQAEELEKNLNKSFEQDADLEQAIAAYLNDVHPDNDGKSSARVLAAVDDVIAQGVKKKPFNVFRKLKIRKMLNYYK